MEYAEVNLQALQFILGTDLHKYENTVSNSNIRKDGGLSSVQPTIGPERKLRNSNITGDKGGWDITIDCLHVPANRGRSGCTMTWIYSPNIARCQMGKPG